MTKHFQIRMEPEEVDEFERIAEERGYQGKQDAGLAALRAWMKADPTSPFPKVTPEENQVLRCVLKCLRSADTRKPSK